MTTYLTIQLAPRLDVIVDNAEGIDLVERLRQLLAPHDMNLEQVVSDTITDAVFELFDTALNRGLSSADVEYVDITVRPPTPTPPVPTAVTEIHTEPF